MYCFDELPYIINRIEQYKNYIEVIIDDRDNIKYSFLVRFYTFLVRDRSVRRVRIRSPTVN